MALDVGEMDLDDDRPARGRGRADWGSSRPDDDDDDLPRRSRTEPLPDERPAGADATADLKVADPNGEQRFATMDKGLFRIGRETDNDVVLVDMRASRYHCELRRKGDSFEVQDLGSGNGTLVNDKPVTRKILEPGDVIVVGKTSITFSPGARPGRSDPEVPAPPPDPTMSPGVPVPPAPAPAPGPGPAPPSAAALGDPPGMPAAYELPAVAPDNAGATAAVFVVLGGVALLFVAFLAFLGLFLLGSSGGDKESATAALDEPPPAISEPDYDAIAEPLVKAAGARYDQGQYFLARRQVKAALRVHAGHKKARSFLGRVERTLATRDSRALRVTFDPPSPKRGKPLTVRLKLSQPVRTVRATFADAPLPMELSREAAHEYMGTMKVPRRLKPGQHQLDLQLVDLEDDTFEVGRRVTVR